MLDYIIGVELFKVVCLNQHQNFHNKICYYLLYSILLSLNFFAQWYVSCQLPVQYGFSSTSHIKQFLCQIFSLKSFVSTKSRKICNPLLNSSHYCICICIAIVFAEKTFCYISVSSLVFTYFSDEIKISNWHFLL